MTQTAFLLTLLSAALHATWNYWLKRSEQRATVIFGAGYVTVALGLPFYLWLGHPAALLGPVGLLVVASAVLHYVYRVLLSATYDRADLSLAYPVARSAPILVALGAVTLLGEQVRAVGWLGIGVTMGGILVLYREELTAMRRGSLRGLAWAVGTMISIACYTLVDKHGMSLGELHPAEFFYTFDVLLTLLYTATVRRRKLPGLWRTWRAELPRVVGIGVVEPLSYTLILAAFTMAQASYVVCVRQVSVVLAALLGVVLLKERASASRVAGALLVVAGVVLLRLFG